MWYSNEDIKYQLNSDLEFVKSKGFIPCAIYLFGSQNYKLDTVQSDLDRRALVIPTIEDLINKKNLNKEYDCANGKVQVLDIRNWINNLIKGSFSDWEIFSTEHTVTDFSFQYFDSIYPMKNNIMKINPVRSLRCMCGILNDYARGFQKSKDKNECSFKSLANVIRISELITKYFSLIDSNSQFTSSIFLPFNVNFIKEIKEYGCDVDEAVKLCEYHKTIANDLSQNISELWKDKKENESTKEWLGNFKIEIIKKHLWLGELNK